MKRISNIFKVIVVIYIMFEYHIQSQVAQMPLSADNCKGLLFIGIACFFILCPVDASIFAKNFLKFKNQNHNENKRDIHNREFEKYERWKGDEHVNHFDENID